MHAGTKIATVNDRISCDWIVFRLRYLILIDVVIFRKLSERKADTGRLEAHCVEGVQVFQLSVTRGCHVAII